MTTTQNLNLPQFEADDRIMRTDFNDAFDKIDAAVPRIVTGTYTGNGAESRTIDLPFAPRFAVVFSHYTRYNATGNDAVYFLTQGDGRMVTAQGSEAVFLSLDGDRFQISQGGTTTNNVTGKTVTYILFR